MSQRLAKKVLLIGWDAADWKVINPLLDAGLMPTLENFINNGVMGNLATLMPPLSPMLWTSIATGKRADKHGILGFTEPNIATGGIRPVVSTSRKTKAIWNILNQQHFKSNVIGWWPSHPPEPINGIMLSNFYHKARFPTHDIENLKDLELFFPLAPDSVHPKELTDLFSKLRLHPFELTEAHILPFVPELKKIDLSNNNYISGIIKILAEAVTIHSAATWAMEHTEWDFMAIYYDAIDHFSHLCMRFHPPQMPGIPDDLFVYYKDVVTGAYRFHDMMLERLLNLSGNDTTVILISDHGFHSNHLRPKKLPEEPAAPAYEHSPYGIFAAKGPFIKKDERIYGASLLDITPTILTLFGLPVAKDMDGRPLIQIFSQNIAPEVITSWDTIEGNSGMHPVEKQEDPLAANEALEQLIALGYIERPDPDNEKSREITIAENKYNMALVYIDANQHEKAIPILLDLYTKNYKLRYALKLASCYHALNQMSNCRKILDDIKNNEANNPQMLPTINFFEGNYYLGINRIKKAVEFFEKAEALSPSLPNLFLQLGNAYFKMNNFDKSEVNFLKAIEVDSNNANAHYGLGRTYLKQNRYDDAANEFLTSIGLLYYNPFAHYHLGESLYFMGEYEHAVNAFEVCVSISPNIKKAHKWLVKIYNDHLNNKDKAQEHLHIIETCFIGEIVIVSGLPRSGTSLMMQMLQRGGMELLTDHIRQPDENNPCGYFEYELVKRLNKDNSWLYKAEDKAIKIISHLLFFLPENYRYKIIFMERDIDEIIRSQQKMLQYLGKNIPDNSVSLTIAQAFSKNLQQVDKWIENKNNVALLKVQYTDVINNPLYEAERINAFLNYSLNVDNMITAIDHSLYRTKKQ